MPEALERKLKAEARQKFPGDQARQDRYVYGTLQKLKDKRTGRKAPAGHHL
jgi:hypothetical protein